jgi:hypothetical protein
MTDVPADPADFNPAQPSWWAWKVDDARIRPSGEVIAVLEVVWDNPRDPFGTKHLFIANIVAVAGAEGDKDTYQLLENRRELATALTLEEFRALVRGGVFCRIG